MQQILLTYQKITQWSPSSAFKKNSSKLHQIENIHQTIHRIENIHQTIHRIENKSIKLNKDTKMYQHQSKCIQHIKNLHRGLHQMHF